MKQGNSDEFARKIWDSQRKNKKAVEPLQKRKEKEKEKLSKLLLLLIK